MLTSVIRTDTLNHLDAIDTHADLRTAGTIPITRAP